MKNKIEQYPVYYAELFCLSAILVIVAVAVVACSPKQVSMDLDDAQYYYGELAKLVERYSVATNGVFADMRAPTESEREEVIRVRAGVRSLLNQAKRDIRVTDSTRNKLFKLAETYFAVKEAFKK